MIQGHEARLTKTSTGYHRGATQIWARISSRLWRVLNPRTPGSEHRMPTHSACRGIARSCTVSPGSELSRLGKPWWVVRKCLDS